MTSWPTDDWIVPERTRIISDVEFSAQGGSADVATNWYQPFLTGLTGIHHVIKATTWYGASRTGHVTHLIIEREDRERGEDSWHSLLDFICHKFTVKTDDGYCEKYNCCHDTTEVLHRTQPSSSLRTFTDDKSLQQQHNRPPASVNEITIPDWRQTGKS